MPSKHSQPNQPTQNQSGPDAQRLVLPGYYAPKSFEFKDWAAL